MSWMVGQSQAVVLALLLYGANDGVANDETGRTEEEMLQAPRFSVTSQVDATGVTLRLLEKQHCTNPPRTCRKPVPGARIVVKNRDRQKVFAGTTTAGGSLRRNWDDVPAESLVDALREPATVEIEGKGSAGTVDLSAARPHVGRTMLARVWARAADDDVEGATKASKIAVGLGVDKKEVQLAIDSAPSVIRQHEEEAARVQAEKTTHLERARAAIKRNDPEAATEEVVQLERLGENVTALRRDIEATPKARATAREAERRQKHEEKQALQEEQRRRAKEEEEERRRRAKEGKEVRVLRHRALRTTVPRLMLAVMDGSIDRLQMALNASAAMHAGSYQISRIDGRTVVAVLAAGDRGLPEAARAMGFTAAQVRTYAEDVFGPKLFARFVTAAATDTPMATSVERLRNAGSYDFMRGLVQKEFDDELSRLASAYVSSIGGDLRLYDPALAMLRIVVPLLLYSDPGG